MKLNTSQLQEGENSFHYSSEKDTWLQELVTLLRRDGAKLRSPIEFSLKLTKLEPDYFLKGRMGCVVEQCCARCAETFGLKVQHPFELALVHSKNERGIRNSTAVSEEAKALDISYFEGPEIDLTPLMSEQFFLSLPYQALCNRDCKGVCQSCGTNLNERACSCSTPLEKPSPFEVLKSLKTTQTQR